MGKGTKCAGCAKDLAAEAFDKGDAVHLLGKAYCGPCMKERVARSKTGDFIPEFRTPRPNDLKKHLE